jgi:hypothetical protein
MPEGLTQTKTPTSKTPAGFKSECRPVSFRNGGRLQIGTLAGFTSEYPAGINRNPHYVPGWVAMAEAAKAKRCSPGGAAWTTDVRAQGDFCLSAGTAASEARTEEMKRVISVCDVCSEEVDVILKAVMNNVLYSCGFSDAQTYGGASPSYSSESA